MRKKARLMQIAIAGKYRKPGANSGSAAEGLSCLANQTRRHRVLSRRFGRTTGKENRDHGGNARGCLFTADGPSSLPVQQSPAVKEVSVCQSRSNRSVLAWDIRRRERDHPYFVLPSRRDSTNSQHRGRSRGFRGVPSYAAATCCSAW